MLSGHSQGGTRAQMMSMYLKKTRGLEVETVSFSGTGAKCMAGLVMNDDANYLDDVDPDIEHTQVGLSFADWFLKNGLTLDLLPKLRHSPL